MTTIVNFKEQTLLTIQERSNAPFYSGCKMFTWTCNDNPIKVEFILIIFKKKIKFSFLFEFDRIFYQLNLIMIIRLFYQLKLNNMLKVKEFFIKV